MDKYLLCVPILTELFLLVRTTIFWCTVIFITSFLHGLMIRKDNSGSGKKHCFSALNNDSILIAADKGLALGLGKDLLLLLEIVWSVCLEWASCHWKGFVPTQRNKAQLFLLLG